MPDFFRAFEQGTGRYTPHLFRDRTHFVAWCRVHRPRRMAAASGIHGRCNRPVDHREEIDPAVDTAESALRFEQLSPMTNLSAFAPACAGRQADY